MYKIFGLNDEAVDTIIGEWFHDHGLYQTLDKVAHEAGLPVITYRQFAERMLRERIRDEFRNNLALKEIKLSDYPGRLEELVAEGQSPTGSPGAARSSSGPKKAMDAGSTSWIKPYRNGECAAFETPATRRDRSHRERTMVRLFFMSLDHRKGRR